MGPSWLDWEVVFERSPQLHVLEAAYAASVHAEIKAGPGAYGNRGILKAAGARQIGRLSGPGACRERGDHCNSTHVSSLVMMRRRREC